MGCTLSQLVTQAGHLGLTLAAAPRPSVYLHRRGWSSSLAQSAVVDSLGVSLLQSCRPSPTCLLLPPPFIFTAIYKDLGDRFSKKKE